MNENINVTLFGVHYAWTLSFAVTQIAEELSFFSVC